MRAAADELAVRDQLRDMAAAVGPTLSTEEQLQQAGERIDRAIAEQKAVIGQTQATRDKQQLAAAGAAPGGRGRPDRRGPAGGG